MSDLLATIKRENATVFGRSSEMALPAAINDLRRMERLELQISR
jgi:hypothetical protein